MNNNGKAIQAYSPPQQVDIFKLGKVLAVSGYFADAKQEAQAIVKVLAGQELGIGAIQAMTGIYIVKGRVTLSANLMAALVKRSGRYNYKVTRLDDEGCTITFYEGATALGDSAFTHEDAKKAQLGGETYNHFPRNMYFSRALSNGVKWYCPDVGMGPLYTPDELGETVDYETGEIISTPTEPEPLPAMSDSTLRRAIQVSDPSTVQVEAAEPYIEAVRLKLSQFYSAFGKTALEGVTAKFMADYPHANHNGVFKASALEADEAAAVISYLDEEGLNPSDEGEA